MSQLSLLDMCGPLPTKEQLAQEKRQEARAARPSIDQRFAEFHAANPHVFDELKRLATARVNAGAKRISMKALWEELRSSLIRIADGGGPDETSLAYKLNNDFTALYARMLSNYPAFAQVLETRKRKAEK